jgi:hypothetical protein
LSFYDVFERIKSSTPIKNQADLAVFLGNAPTQISKQKKKEQFPLEWAYKIAVKYQLSTDWLMRGERPTQNGSNVTVLKKIPFIYVIEEWLDQLVIDNPKAYDWFEMEFEIKFPMFKEWKHSKEEVENFDYTASSRKIA